MARCIPKDFVLPALYLLGIHLKRLLNYTTQNAVIYICVYRISLL